MVEMASMALLVAGNASERDMLCLLGGPYVVQQGFRCNVPESSQRLLAYVALQGGRVDRSRAAGTLWPYGSDNRAAGNLRSALWRLKGAGIEILQSDKAVLSLKPGTVTDVQQLCDWAARAIEGRVTDADLRILHWDPEAADILPGWHDDWVICERERIRQRLLHGLEAVGYQLLRHERPADAIEAAMEAVRIEPLRESSQRLLVEAHLAERNYGEALRAYRTYERLLEEELRITPSPALSSLVSTAYVTSQ
jgi:DNA-binding SARP family transcriptional activator